MSKDYYGKCGMCRYCELGTAYTFAYSTSFTCSRFKRSVKANEKTCGSFEPTPGRTNAIVAQYDK